MEQVLMTAKHTILVARDAAGTVWSRCRLRKHHLCHSCKEPLPKGSFAYLPMSNKNDRMNRLCIHCLKATAVDLRTGT